MKSLSTSHAPVVVWRLVCAFCHSSLTSYGMNCFLIFHSLLACSFQGLGHVWLCVFPLSTHSLLLLQSCCHSCHTTLLFLPWCHLTRACWASLGLLLFFSQWLNMVIGLILMLLWAFLNPLHCLWAPLSHFFLLGHAWPICFPWASLTHFLILHTHGHLLTLLGFLDPTTLSFILGVYGLSINPILSYFITSGLLRPILTFLHYITLMGLLFLSPSSFRPVCFPQGPFIYFTSLWTIVPAIRA